MVKIDLITGFLGSGKTTFIKKYATYLMRKGLNIGILENDHGAVNVDMMLLQELRGDQCELEMIQEAAMQRRTDEDSGPSLFQWECVGMTGFWSNRQEFMILMNFLMCSGTNHWITGMRLAM